MAEWQPPRLKWTKLQCVVTAYIWPYVSGVSYSGNNSSIKEIKNIIRVLSKIVSFQLLTSENFMLFSVFTKIQRNIFNNVYDLFISLGNNQQNSQ